LLFLMVDLLLMNVLLAVPDKLLWVKALLLGLLIEVIRHPLQLFQKEVPVVLTLVSLQNLSLIFKVVLFRLLKVDLNLSVLILVICLGFKVGQIDIQLQGYALLLANLGP
jgi:hypothetical protein